MTLGKPPALSELSLPIQKMGPLPKMSPWPVHVQTSQNPVGLPEAPSSPMPRQVELGMTSLTALGTAPCRARPLQPGSLGSNRGSALPSCAPLDELLHLPSLSIPISEMGTVVNVRTSEWMQSACRAHHKRSVTAGHYHYPYPGAGGEAPGAVCPGRPFGSQRALKGAAEDSSRWTTPPFLSIPFFFC